MYPHFSVLRIRRRDIEALRRESEACRPEEACGLLIGSMDGPVATVTDVYTTENIDHSPVRFTVSPQTLCNMLLKAEGEGKDLVGIFHSHPAPAQPSDIDLDRMRLNPVVWLIISITDGSLAAYQYQDGKIGLIEID